jgi:glutamate synthase (NADPH/NADH) large chain
LIRPLDEMLDLEPLDLPVQRDEREAAGLIAARPIRMGVKETSARIAALAADVVPGRKLVRAWDEPADADDRVLGTELAGAISRRRIYEDGPPSGVGTMASLSFNAGSVGGQGLGAFNVYGVDITVEGGAQDGVAKTMYGGKVAVMKGLDGVGRRTGGSVGKSFAYGAQRGRLFVQGDADSRFCIRLSGADVVIGGEPSQPLEDSLGCVADRANIKGFAFEYMTAGRAVVLGDPGPWLCAGQTGGRVYLRINPAWNLDRAALERRRGKGAKVAIEELDTQGELDVRGLLSAYADELRATGQDDEAERVLGLAAAATEHFLMSVPEAEQTDPSISTE